MKKQRKRRAAPRRKPIKGARPRRPPTGQGRWSGPPSAVDPDLVDKLDALSRVARAKMPPDIRAEFERLEAGEPWPEESPEWDRLLELENEFFPLVTDEEVEADIERMRQERQEAPVEAQKPEE
jgi:hypothetical protein